MKLSFKRIIATIVFLSIVFASNAATFTVSSNADNGAGTLRQALQDVANTTGGPHTIVFTIPAGSIININNSLSIYNDTDFNGLTINGFIDNIAGPDVIIRGNSGNVCNGIKGFDISAPITGLKIYGLHFDNLDYGIYFNANNQGTANGSVIKGCYFGSNLAGSAIGSGICHSGIYLNGTSSVTIGGPETNLANGTGLSTNNLGNCLFVNNALENVEAQGIRTSALKLQNSDDVQVLNSFFGVDITGATKLGNGNPTALKHLAHSNIYANNSKRFTISQNVISGAVGCGIHLENWCNNSVIKGNKIGTNAAGTAAYNATTPSLSFSNMSCGIFIQSGTSIVIGNNGGGATDRNIISGNGGAKHNNWQNTCDFGFSDYNQYGIYCESVENMNIKGNYIGTDVTGNSSGVNNVFGNRAGGVKIVTVDDVGGKQAINNTIGGTTAADRNIVSGNGYLWKASVNSPNCGGAASSGITGGGGILLQYQYTKNNSILGNYIGLGADGTTLLGNFGSGVEILGATNNTIGDVNGPNYISNNSWGVFLQQDYRAQNANNYTANGNVIKSNIIGLTTTNAIAGNGIRTIDTDGGGIGIQDGAYNNTIGVAQVGGGNVIAGNRNGILIQNDEVPIPVANSNKFYNNRIGVDATGAAKPNGSTSPGYGYGILIRVGPTGTTLPWGNIIGGTAANQANIISANQRQGIYITNPTAYPNPNAGNQIIGNYIGTDAANSTTIGNGGSGIWVERVSGSNHTNGTIIKSNVIGKNTGNGIELFASSFNTIQDNVIGTDRATKLQNLGNTQNGVSITDGASNIIGGIVAGESNTIARNTLNGVIVNAATANTANLNSIHQNSFDCNGERGIVLQGATANGGIKTATILGSSTQLTFTNPNAFDTRIEIYEVSACATCPTDPTKLQGKTLITTGNVAASGTFAFTIALGFSSTKWYTAILHEGSSITTTAVRNSSEFSQCYVLCSNPTPTLAGTFTQCEGSTGVVFNVSNANSGSTFVWVVPTGVTITSTPTNTSSITVTIGSAPITGKIKVTETVIGGCIGKDSVVLNIKANPSNAVVGPPQDLCNATTVTLAATAPTSGTGTWTVSPSGPTFSDANSPSAIASVLTVGTDYIFTWTVANAPCVAKSATVSVKTKALPTTASVTTPSVAQCTTATVTLDGNNPLVGTGLWTVSPTGPTINTPTSPTSGVTGLVAGSNYTFTWTISNAPCAASSATKTVRVDQNPSNPVVGSDITQCATSTATLNATAPTIGSGAWTVSPAGPTITTPTSPTSGVSGLVAGSNYVFTWTVSNGTCAPKTANVNLFNKAQPTVASVSTPTVDQCATSTVTLDGNTPLVGTGLWTVTPTGPTITSPSSPTSDVTGMVAGTNYTFTWTISNTPCTASTANKIVRVDQNPSASIAGSDIVQCATSTANLNATSPSIGNGSWSVKTGTGVTIATPSSPTTQISGLVAGNTYTLTWTIQSPNNICAASTDDVDVKIDANPTAANAGKDSAVCNLSSIALYANTLSIGTGTWSVSPAGPTFVDATSPTTTASNLNAGTNYTFTWTSSNGVCANSTDDMVLSISSPQAKPSLLGSTSLCNINTTSVSASPSGGSWSFSNGSTGTIATPTSTTTSVTFNEDTVYVVYTTAPGVCAAEKDSVRLVNTQLVLPSTLGTFDFCASTADIDLSVAATAASAISYKWSIESGDVSITTADDLKDIKVSSGLLGGIVKVLVSTGACLDLPVTATIGIKANNSVADAGADFTTCLSGVQLLANNPANGTGTWEVVNASGITFTPDVNSDTVDVAGLVDGNLYEFVWKISGACGVEQTDTVKVKAGLTGFSLVDLLGPNDTLCFGTGRNLEALVTGGSGNFTYHWTATDGYSANTTTGANTVTPNQNKIRYYVYITDNLNIGCTTGMDSVDINSIGRQDLVITNLITPNDDNKNDLFIIRDVNTGKDLIKDGSKLIVTNRWGDKVFTAKDYENNWKAQELSDGMYYYHLETGCGKEEYKGWVQILGNTHD